VRWLRRIESIAAAMRTDSHTQCAHWVQNDKSYLIFAAAERALSVSYAASSPKGRAKIGLAEDGSTARNTRLHPLASPSG